MRTRIVVDRGQAIWAAQKAIAEEFPRRSKGKKAPAALFHAIWQSILNSPAYGIHGIDVIYLQSDIPEDFLPMILNHEELHLLVYHIIKEDYGDNWRAAKISRVIDKPRLNEWLCEVFEIDYQQLIRYLRIYVLKNLPLVRTLVKLGRRLKNAFSKRRD